MSTKNIKIDSWGVDHWSTLAYIETRIVDYKGIPNLKHMRCNHKIHPGLTSIDSGSKYQTRLKDGKISNHDDWSCLEDAVAEGLLIWGGTGIAPVFSLTRLGWAVCAALRRHKATHHTYSSFHMTSEDLDRMKAIIDRHKILLFAGIYS